MESACIYLQHRRTKMDPISEMVCRFDEVSSEHLSYSV